ncbi:MAG: GTPase ObgE [Ignavibacteriales bacterium]|nr:GTPase ObgE [Ignavibacteriales bacterium]
MQFIDEVTIHVRGGNGGNGCISFRREKYVPKGGPDGGNGGHGGSVIIRADRHLSTLLDFKYRARYVADRGQHGRGKKQDGKWGKDLVLRVPCGTIVRDAVAGVVLGDLTEHDQEILVARGGKGGRGNAEFATPTDQAPRRAEAGTAGQERLLQLELKLLADVGLVGLPNAGKSTLISVISAAKPKIADYPFTTLVPNLGIVRIGGGRSLVVADIPGLIEDAHQGKGLGIQFLRHIERTRVLVFLLEASRPDPKADYAVLLNELKSFDSALVKKPRIVVLTKMDIVEGEKERDLRRLRFVRGVKPILISAVTGRGVQELVRSMWKLAGTSEP